MLCPNCHANTNNFRVKNEHCGRTHYSKEFYELSEEEAELRNKARRYAKKEKIKIQQAESILENNPELYNNTRIKLEDIECPFCHKIFHPKSHL